MDKKCLNCGKRLSPHKMKYCSDNCQRVYSLEGKLVAWRYRLKNLNNDLERFVANLYAAADIYNKFVILQETVGSTRKWNMDIRLLDNDLEYENQSK